MSSRFTIVVEGITDHSIVLEIEKTIRDSFHQMALPGAWRVRVRLGLPFSQWQVPNMCAAWNRLPTR